MSAAPVTAGWLGKKAVRKPEPAVSTAQPGFAGSIRRLMGEAQAAADRGDLEQARKYAERAHKLAVTCRTTLANAPDCSPEQTAAFVRRFAAPTTSSAVAISSPQLTSPPPANLPPIPAAPPTEPAPLVPPSPAPEEKTAIDSPRTTPPAIIPKRTAKTGTGSVSQSPAKPAAPKPVASAAKAKPQQLSPSRAAEPWQTPGNRRVPSQSHGFLVMRSDWLAGDADAEELLEDLDDAPESRSPTPRRSFRARKSAKKLEEDEPAEEPEVTTAIGRDQDSQWELDLNSVETDSSWESRPMLEHEAAPEISRVDDPKPSAAILDTTEQASQPIGVWKGNGPAVGLTSRVRNVVSLSEFFDPTLSVSAGHLGRSVTDDAPRMIETDFRVTPAPQAKATTAAAVNLPGDSDSAESTQHADKLVRTSREPLQARSYGACVSYREDPALDWLPVTDPAVETRPVVRTWYQTAWQKASGSQVNQFAAVGLILVMSGLMLFGLSFRRI